MLIFSSDTGTVKMNFWIAGGFDSIRWVKSSNIGMSAAQYLHTRYSSMPSSTNPPGYSLTPYAGPISIHISNQLQLSKTSCLFHEVFQAIEAQSNKRPIGPNLSDCALFVHGPR